MASAQRQQGRVKQVGSAEHQNASPIGNGGAVEESPIAGREGNAHGSVGSDCCVLVALRVVLSVAVAMFNDS